MFSKQGNTQWSFCYILFYSSSQQGYYLPPFEGWVICIFSTTPMSKWNKRSRLVKSTIYSLMHTLVLDKGCSVHWMGWIHLVPEPMLITTLSYSNLLVLAFQLVFFFLNSDLSLHITLHLVPTQQLTTNLSYPLTHPSQLVTHPLHPMLYLASTYALLKW